MTKLESKFDLEEEPGGDSTFCPQCGWNVDVDEDGGCTGCGATATGLAVDDMAEVLEDLKDIAQELCSLMDRVHAVAARFELVEDEDLEVAQPILDA